VQAGLFGQWDKAELRRCTELIRARWRAHGRIGAVPVPRPEAGPASRPYASFASRAAGPLGGGCRLGGTPARPLSRQRADERCSLGAGLERPGTHGAVNVLRLALARANARPRDLARTPVHEPTRHPNGSAGGSGSPTRCLRATSRSRRSLVSTRRSAAPAPALAARSSG